MSVLPAAAAGLALGAGLLLIASPWVWPAGDQPRRARRAGVLRRRLDAAGLPDVPAAVVVATCLLLAVVAAAAVLAFAPIPGLALAAAVAAASAPVLLLARRARMRRRRVRAAWPDLVDHLVAAFRAGIPLAEAVASLADVAPVDVRPAFREFGRTALGTGTVAVALDRLKDDLADPVADRVVETLRLARDVGGTELPGVLRSLAASLRADAAIRSEVEARQSWIRGAARLGVLAPWVVLALLATRPETVAAYSSPAGLVLLVVGLAVTVVAYRLMLALGRLPDERRWFA